MILNAVFLLIYIFLSSFLDGVILYYLFTAHMMLYIYTTLRQKKIITPIFLFAVGIIFVNLGNIVLIDQVHAGKVTQYRYLVPRYIDESALIWCVSCTLIIMGFSVVKASFPRISFDVTNHQLKILFNILFLMNLLTIFGHGLSNRGMLKIYGILNTIGILFFARLWAIQNSKRYRNYAILLFVEGTYIALTTSFLRIELIMPTVCLFIGYFVGKGNVKYLFSYHIIPYVVIAGLYMSVFASLQNNRANFIEAFSSSDDTYNEGAASSNSPSKKEDALFVRSSNVAQMSNVVNLVRKNGLYMGKASAPLVIALIPRALWPEKPNIQIGRWFALEIGVAYQDAQGNINNSINMTVAGELYLDFGWVGIVIGSILVGMLTALLWNATEFYSSEYNFIGTIFGGYLFIILFIGFAADLEIVITFMSLYVSFFLIKKAAQLLS